MNEEGRLLKLILSLCSVSASIATQATTSLSKTRYLANKCFTEIDKSYWSMIEEKDEQSQEIMKKQSKAHETLKSLNLSCYLTDNGSIRASISVKEESLRKNKQALLAIQQSRTKMSKVRIRTF